MYDKLTRKDIEKMEQEIEHRKLVVRKEALEDVKEARAHGDLSENFEYKAAKKFKNENESRIRYLEKMIKTAQIVEDDSNETEIGLNHQKGERVYVSVNDKSGYYVEIRDIRKSDDESEQIRKF